MISCGSDSGHIFLFGYKFNAFAQILDSFKAHQNWVTSMCWSEWHEYPQGLGAYLATGSTDGTVYVWQVFAQEGEMTVLLKIGVVENMDFREATVMRFYDDETIKFVVAKGCRVWVWIPSPSEGVGSVFIVDIPFSKPVSGLTWGNNGKILHVYTTDGKSFDIAFFEGVEPVLCEDNTEVLNRRILYGEVLDDELDGEGEDGDGDRGGVGRGRDKVVNVCGAATSFSCLFDVVVYQVSSHVDLEPRTMVSEVSYFFVFGTFQADDEGLEERVLEKVLGKLRNEKLWNKITSSYLTWDLIEYCESEFKASIVDDDSFFFKLLGRFQGLFQGNSMDRNELEVSLKATMCVSHIIRNVWYTIGKAGKQPLIASCAKTIKKLTILTYLEIRIAEILDYITKDPQPITYAEIIMLTLYSNTIIKLSPEQQNQQNHILSSLLKILQFYLSTQDTGPFLTSKLNESLRDINNRVVSGPVEICPACLGEIPYNSCFFAKCENGHVWDRCCFTFLPIFTTEKVRVCTSCDLKALVPNIYVSVDFGTQKFTYSDSKGVANGVVGAGSGVGVGMTGQYLINAGLKKFSVCLGCGNRMFERER
ncbi:hypothetical protein HK098_002683 [Nowakowskiella sp. JEL0407]|nr:hypothetical protein HK098_002683 [Nowakowskiella sp. JEL0407]